MSLLETDFSALGTVLDYATWIVFAFCLLSTLLSGAKIASSMNDHEARQNIQGLVWVFVASTVASVAVPMVNLLL